LAASVQNTGAVGDLRTLLAGIDAGTSATKACLFTPGGSIVSQAIVPVTLEHRVPGFAEQPADVLVASACDALAAAAREAPGSAIAAIGLTGQMGGLVLVDGDGRAVSPHLSWLDGRVAPEIERAMASRGPWLLSLGGLSPYLAPKAAWWKRERPAEFAQARGMVMAAGYVALGLGEGGAEECFVDRPASGFVGLYDVAAGEVSNELCELWGISRSLVPRVAGAGEIVGHLSRPAADRTGIPAGTPLVAAPGDGPCGWLGVGAVVPGLTVDTAGTSDHIGICGERFAPDTDDQVLICLPSAAEGLWHLQGFTNGTGLTHRWFLDGFPGSGGFAELELLAERVPPGSEELLAVPHFGGRTCPYEPAVSGAFVGLSWHHRREHLYRALLESVAYEYACYFEAARRLEPNAEPSEVRVIGGGASSGLWTRIKADVLGVPFALMEEKNYTCWGAALCAGVGAGVFDDLAAPAQAALRVRAVVEPRPAANEVYRGLLVLYKELYGALADPYRALWERRQQSSQRAGL
jgi:xylulokinase